MINRFTADRRIFVVGFGLYGSVHGPTDYDVNLQVIHTASGNVCGSNSTSFSCDGNSYTFRVMFKEPVEIQPNTSYTASATLKVSSMHVCLFWYIYFNISGQLGMTLRQLLLILFQNSLLLSEQDFSL